MSGEQKEPLSVKIETSLANYEIFPALSSVIKYRLRFAFYIASVPMLCSLVLLALVLIFSKLNLYYLEGEGVVIDPQVRVAYFDQVLLEVMPLIGWFALLVGFTFAIGFIVVGWATYPFSSAHKDIQSTLNTGEIPKIRSGFFTESREFDETIQGLLHWTKSGVRPDALKSEVKRGAFNVNFLVKFILIFIPLSILTSLSLAVLMTGIYAKIVSLALNLLHSKTIANHYILAQQEVLADGQNIMLCASIVLYAIIGQTLARHLATMIFVFRRAIHEDKLPLFLRPRDVYHDLAATVNTARERCS